MIPAKGRTRNGIRAVAVSGIASVIHQAAISATSPATTQAWPAMPPGAGNISVAANIASPATNPIVLAFMPMPVPSPFSVRNERNPCRRA